MSTVKMYCYVVMSEPSDPDYATVIYCACLYEAMAKQVCKKMNAIDRFNNYKYYKVELYK